MQISNAPTTPQRLEFVNRKDFVRNRRVTFGAWLIAICGSQRQLKKPKVLVTFENHRMMAQNGKNPLCPEVRTNLGGV